MNNEHAIALTEAANKYLTWNAYHFTVKSKDEKMFKFIALDYSDLMFIAALIEIGEDKKKISKAMWDLDTAVRDVIPNKVYKAYAE